MPKITKRSVDNFAPRAKSYFEWDSEIKGFGVRIMPSGTKTYQIQYRKGGRTRRASIGRHGNITAEQARNRAKELMGDLSKGENPVEEIAQHRRAPSVAALCERFFEQHVLERCKPRTQGEYRRALDKFIIPAIGSFKVIDVERRDIADLHHKHRNIPYQANRTLGVLSKMFNMAEIWGQRPDGSNPCRHVPKYREAKRERYLDQSELLRLGIALSEAEANGSETVYVIAAFRLLILTGCRLSEIQKLKWEDVTGDTIALTDSKTGARRIPLPSAARNILNALPRADGNSFVVAGKIEGQYATDMQKPWRRLRERAGLPDIRIHDLRHSYASNAISAGTDLALLMRLLGHTQIQTTMRYAHLYDASVREAAEANAERLSSLVGGRNTDRNTLRIVGG